MYVTRIPNRNSPPAVLLREGYRENGKVKTRTLANLSALPDHVIALIKRALKGETLAATEDLFEVVASAQHGTVQAIVTAMKRLGIERLLDSRPSRERRLVMGMIAARILEPQSKLATTRWWRSRSSPKCCVDQIELGCSSSVRDQAACSFSLSSANASMSRYLRSLQISVTRAAVPSPAAAWVTMVAGRAPQ